jgi:hypothetical protein
MQIYLDVALSNERFECSLQSKVDVAVGFFRHHQRMTNNL